VGENTAGMGQKKQVQRGKKKVTESRKRKKNSQPVLTTSVSKGIGTKEKGTPIGAPSIHRCIGGCWFTLPLSHHLHDQISNQPHKMWA
jgi:hypothetical protein